MEANQTNFVNYGSHGIVSSELLQDFMFANNVIVLGIISSFGLIFNVINIIVFAKMGFKDPVNIALTSLAVSDIGCLGTCLWVSLCYNPLVVNKYTNFDFQGVQHLTAGWPHFCFSRITSWLTVLITFERYLCVAFPLKVRTIVTPRNTFVAALIIFFVGFLALVPLYMGESLGPIIVIATNKTVITLIYHTNGQALENISNFATTAYQLTTFFLNSIFTVGLVQNIRSKSKWRQKTSSASKNESSSHRDKILVKMIIYISIIFTVCYLPSVIFSIASLTVDGFAVKGSNSNLFLLSAALLFVLESINSSTNIFVYLKMSSKYRATFLSLFRLAKE